MKVRIISGIAGLILIIIMLFTLNTVIFNIALSLISGIAAVEIALALKTAGNKLLLTLNIIFALTVPFAALSEAGLFITFAAVIYMILFISLVVFQKNMAGFTRTIATGALTVFYTLTAYSFILIRDLYQVASDKNIHKNDAVFLLLLCMFCSWGADVGAYFAGVYLGKHKLCPAISPKKTVEGLIGGVLSSVIFVFLLAVIYKAVADKPGGIQDITRINYLPLILIAIAATLLSVMGDLFSSMIKRANNLKDFGEIMPGHGGVLDRFDSIFVVLPFIYVMLQMVEIFYRL